jgi:GxxExxY protein
VDQKQQANSLSNEIIGAAIEVHKSLGPGLLESAYQACHKHELSLRGIPVETEVALPLEYKGVKLDCGYRMDEVVGGLVVVEIKSVDCLEPIHEAQLLTYLRLSGLWLGLLINFNVPILKQGIKRLVHG